MDEAIRWGRGLAESPQQSSEKSWAKRLIRSGGIVAPDRHLLENILEA